MTVIIRLTSELDAEQMQAIYAPFVLHTSVSFEIEAPSVEEMRQRIVSTLPRYPWLVCEYRGGVMGYAYAGSHRARAAYSWAVETTVYVHETYRGMGVGKALYTSLFKILALQGFYNAYAGITLPNPASVRLHEAMSFQPVGVYRAVGFKLGAWHDVGWWQLNLQEHTAAPVPALSLNEVKVRSEWETALSAGLSWLRL